MIHRRVARCTVLVDGRPGRGEALALATARRATAVAPRKEQRKPAPARKKPIAGRKAKPRKPRRAVAKAPGIRDEARPLAVAIARVGLDHRALDVEVIDVRGKVDYADDVVVMAGRSDRQVGALVRHISEGAQRDLGARCLSVEGMPRATWVLMDFGDVIVHLFHQDTRGYYDIESLFIDAGRVAVSPGS